MAKHNIFKCLVSLSRFHQKLKFSLLSNKETFNKFKSGQPPCFFLNYYLTTTSGPRLMSLFLKADCAVLTVAHIHINWGQLLVKCLGIHYNCHQEKSVDDQKLRYLTYCLHLLMAWSLLWEFKEVWLYIKIYGYSLKTVNHIQICNTFAKLSQILR